MIKLLTHKENSRQILISKEVQDYLKRIVGMKWYRRFLHYEQYEVDVSVSHLILELYFNYL